VLSGFTKAYPRLAPNVKDSVTNIAIFGVAYAKDSLPENEKLKAESDLRTMAGNMIELSREVNKAQAKALCNGDNIDTLDKIIRHGASLRKYVKQEEIEESFQQSLMALAIPRAWSTAERHRPFIM
jgi:hypothetical protein